MCHTIILTALWTAEVAGLVEVATVVIVAVVVRSARTVRCHHRTTSVDRAHRNTGITAL